MKNETQRVARKYMNYWAYRHARRQRKELLQMIGFMIVFLIAMAVAGTGTFPY